MEIGREVKVKKGERSWKRVLGRKWIILCRFFDPWLINHSMIAAPIQIHFLLFLFLAIGLGFYCASTYWEVLQFHEPYLPWVHIRRGPRGRVQIAWAIYMPCKQLILLSFRKIKKIGGSWEPRSFFFLIGYGENHMLSTIKHEDGQWWPTWILMRTQGRVRA